MPERRQPWATQKNQTQNYKPQQTRRVRHKKQEVAESDQTDKRAKACRVLIVNNKANNIMGRDLLSKLGINLIPQKILVRKKINYHNSRRRKYHKMGIPKNTHPHLCKRLGCSKNHIAKMILTKECGPSQHKGRQVP